jgi:hypothetical protein
MVLTLPKQPSLSCGFIIASALILFAALFQPDVV